MGECGGKTAKWYYRNIVMYRYVIMCSVEGSSCLIVAVLVVVITIVVVSCQSAIIYSPHTRPKRFLLLNRSLPLQLILPTIIHKRLCKHLQIGLELLMIYLNGFDLLLQGFQFEEVLLALVGLTFLFQLLQAV